MTKWHELESEMPEKARDEIEKLTGTRPFGFWSLDLVGMSAQGVARFVCLTIHEHKHVFDVYYSAMLFDEVNNREIARYAGTEEQVKALVEETVTFYAKFGLSPVANDGTWD